MNGTKINPVSIKNKMFYIQFIYLSEFGIRLQLLHYVYVF